jgi:hypothetical protein
VSFREASGSRRPRWRSPDPLREQAGATPRRPHIPTQPGRPGSHPPPRPPTPPSTASDWPSAARARRCQRPASLRWLKPNEGAPESQGCDPVGCFRAGLARFVLLELRHAGGRPPRRRSSAVRRMPEGAPVGARRRPSGSRAARLLGVARPRLLLALLDPGGRPRRRDRDVLVLPRADRAVRGRRGGLSRPLLPSSSLR